MELDFVSYDGDFPNLCSGKLIMSIDGKSIEFPDYCLRTGGSAYIDDNGNEIIENGEWDIIKYPENFPECLKKEAIELVNKKIQHGCCGGCI
jgi:hypothetical protein